MTVEEADGSEHSFIQPARRCRCYSGKAALSIRWPQGAIAVMKVKTNPPLRKAQSSMVCLTASRRIPARWVHHCITRCCWGSVPIWGISAPPLSTSRPRVPRLMTGVTMPAVYLAGAVFKRYSRYGYHHHACQLSLLHIGVLYLSGSYRSA